MTRRHVVCICGSNRFWDRICRTNAELTLRGNVVLQAGFNHHAGAPITPEVKAQLDDLHLDKIDMADEVVIVNEGGYMGESTVRELAYAMATDKLVTPVDASSLDAWLRSPAGRPQIEAAVIEMRTVATTRGRQLAVRHPIHALRDRLGRVAEPRVSPSPTAPIAATALRHGERMFQAATARLHHERHELLAQACDLLDHLEAAWGVIANANGGAWDKADAAWRGAAERWRDRYHDLLAASLADKLKGERCIRNIRQRTQRIVEAAASDAPVSEKLAILRGEMDAITAAIQVDWNPLPVDVESPAVVSGAGYVTAPYGSVTRDAAPGTPGGLTRDGMRLQGDPNSTATASTSTPRA